MCPNNNIQRRDCQDGESEVIKRAETFMQIALLQAQKAYAKQEVPVGAVLVKEGKIIAKNYNRNLSWHDPTAHAEILVLRNGGKRLGTHYLCDCDLYVTLEPCNMCATAISLARIRRLFFGAYCPKTGAVMHGCQFFDQNNCFHIPKVYGGILATETSKLLRDFFRQLRAEHQKTHLNINAEDRLV